MPSKYKNLKNSPRALPYLGQRSVLTMIAVSEVPISILLGLNFS